MSYFKEIEIYDDQIGRGSRINPGSGALAADSTTRMVGTMFGAALDTGFWTVASNGTGASAAIGSTATAGVVLLTSGTSNNGYGSLVSVRHARFLFVMPNLFRMACRLTTAAIADCTRRWGATSITAGNPPSLDSGFWFSHDGAGELTVNHKVAGVAAVSVASGAFNGEVATYVVDTNVHAYEILYFVMGAWFFVDGVLIHKFTPTTLTLTNDLNLHIFAESVNAAGGTTSGVLEVWASSIYRLGKLETNPTFYSINGAAATHVVKRGAGILHKLIFNNTSGTAITVYDGISAAGIVIAVITTATGLIGSHDWDIPFVDGLCIVTTGVNLDCTVVFE